MTDREKLLKLYNDIKNIEIPAFDSEAIQVIANTVKEGLNIIICWLTNMAKKHFGNNHNNR